MAVTYGLSLNSQQSWWIWCLCDVENKIIKVERIQQYTKIPAEPPLVIQGFRPPRAWPSEGMIILQNLQVKLVHNNQIRIKHTSILHVVHFCFV